MSGARVIALAALGALSIATAAHADVAPQEIGYNEHYYVDGLLVRVYKVYRNDGDSADDAGDHDWNIVLRPAQCTGRMLGRDCAAERERFLQIFWDGANSDFRNSVTQHVLNPYLTNKGARSQCGLSGSTPRAQWADAHSTPQKLKCFKDYTVAGIAPSMYGGETSVVEAEVELSREYASVERKNLGADLSTLSFTPCEEPSADRYLGGGLCARDVLIFGFFVDDKGHNYGKPEIHPIHGMIVQDARTDRSEIDRVLMFADQGKGAGVCYGNTGCVSEWWGSPNPPNGHPKYYGRPYFATDLTFVNEDRMAAVNEAKAFAHGAPVASDLTCRTTELLSKGAGKLGEVITAPPPRGAIIRGDCFGLRFAGEFTSDGQFVKPGYKAFRVDANWTVVPPAAVHHGTPPPPRPEHPPKPGPVGRH